MKQLETLRAQIGAMKASLNEQAEQKREENKRRKNDDDDGSLAASAGGSAGAGRGRGGGGGLRSRAGRKQVEEPTISRRVKNLDDKILECELKDAKEGLQHATITECSRRR